MIGNLGKFAVVAAESAHLRKATARSHDTKTPESRADLSTDGTTPSMLRQIVQETLPTFNAQHLLTERLLSLGGPSD